MISKEDTYLKTRALDDEIQGIEAYIRERCAKCGLSDKVTRLLISQAWLVWENRDDDGALSNSVVLFVCLRYLGLDPKICFGLCNRNTNGKEFYHVWIELDGKVLDISIFGTLNYSQFDLETKLHLPVIMEDYDTAPFDYGRFVFDEDWNKSVISYGIQTTVFKYIHNSPYNCMYRLIEVTFQWVESTCDSGSMVYNIPKDLSFFDFMSEEERKKNEKFFSPASTITPQMIFDMIGMSVIFK